MAPFGPYLTTNPLKIRKDVCRGLKWRERAIDSERHLRTKKRGKLPQSSKEEPFSSTSNTHSVHREPDASTRVTSSILKKKMPMYGVEQDKKYSIQFKIMYYTGCINA